MNFNYANELLELCEKHNLSISEVMVQREILNSGCSREEIRERMKVSLDIMKESIKRPLTEKVKTMGGLIGGEAKLMIDRMNAGKTIVNNLTAKAIAYSLAVLEVNTNMGTIVAAPTAGASGVIPGLFMALKEELNLSDDVLLDGLLNASAIGYLLMRNASVAGAEAGCQAEVGSASAMAASAVVEMLGGTPQQSMYASTTALQNLLGLVCDPVGGLVEVPCQVRNVIGSNNALTSAEMSLAGIKNIIPLDEMIETMYVVGKAMPMELRETALGGCAKTPTACRLCKNII